MSSQGLLFLIGLKVLIMMTSLQSIFYFGSSRPPDVDGIKTFDKDDQATKDCFLSSCFVAWSSLSKFVIPSTSGDLEHKVLQ